MLNKNKNRHIKKIFGNHKNPETEETLIFFTFKAKQSQTRIFKEILNINFYDFL